MKDSARLRRAALPPALLALAAWTWALATWAPPLTPSADPSPGLAAPSDERPALSVDARPVESVTTRPPAPIESVTARPVTLVDVDLRVAALRGLEVAARLAEGESAAFNATGGSAETSLPLAMRHAAASSGTLRPFGGLAIAATERPDWPERAAASIDACRDAGARAILLPRSVGLGVRREVGGLLPLDHESLDVLFERAFASDLVVIVEGPPPPSHFAPLAGNPHRAYLEAHPEEHRLGERPDGGPWPTHAALLEALGRRLERSPGPTLLLVGPGTIPLDVLRDWLAALPELRVSIDPRAPDTVPLLTEHVGRIAVGSGATVTPEGVRLRGQIAVEPALDALTLEHAALRAALEGLPEEAAAAARLGTAERLFGPPR